MTGRTTGSITADHQRPYFWPRCLKYAACAAVMVVQALLGDLLPHDSVIFGAHLMLMVPPAALCLWYGALALWQGLTLLWGPG